jgi:uncharacterized protein YjbJ (UPF0337 family)
MGLKDELDKVVAKVQDVVGDVQNGASEAAHHAAAKAEREKREAAGDDLTAEQKVGSVLHQSKETIEAEIDAFKRDEH